MNKEVLLEKLAEILEEENIKLTDELESFDEWDSLTSLSLIALADSDYGVTIDNDKIVEFVTIKDVVSFIEKNV
mgnify:CR=1 FL=1